MYNYKITGSVHETGEYPITNNVQVCVEACGSFTVPTLADQTYNIGDSKLTYNADPFVPSNPGSCTFSHTATIESAGSSIFTKDGTNLVHEFYAADNSVLNIADSADYTVTLALESGFCYNNDFSVTYKITVNNPCATVSLSFVGLPTEFTNDLDYAINSGAH